MTLDVKVEVKFTTPRRPFQTEFCRHLTSNNTISGSTGTVPQKCCPDNVGAGAQVELGPQVVEDLVQELQARLLDLGEVLVVVAPVKFLHATVERLQEA